MLIFANIFALSADALSWVLDGCTRLDPVLIGSTYISMIMIFFMIVIFVAYLIAFVQERTEISNKPISHVGVTSSIIILLTTIDCFNGSLYTFEDGRFIEGPYYSEYIAACLCTMLFGVYVIVRVRKHLKKYERFAAYAYMGFPVLTGTVNLFVEGWSFVYPAITLSITMLYVMIQSDMVGRLEREGRIINYHANHDELTGLLNRHAYNDRLDSLKNTEGSSLVIFSDVNGLKYINDNFGHEAGDALIVKYTGLLSGIFRKDDVFRISGDEFLCILANTEETVANHRLEVLANALAGDERPLASIGAAYGENSRLESLIKDAENHMYVEKEKFHNKFPETKRLQ